MNDLKRTYLQRFYLTLAICFVLAYPHWWEGVRLFAFGILAAWCDRAMVRMQAALRGGR